MGDNTVYKIFIAIVFPFFRALLIGNTLFDLLPRIITRDARDFILYFNENRVVLAVMNALLLWVLFYLSVIILFKRDEWLERLHEFSKAFKITVPLGAGLFIYSFFQEAGYVWGLDILGFIYAFFVLLVIAPIVFYEAVELGILIKENKNYGHVISQCLSSFLFVLLPFAAVYYMRVLFHHLVGRG